jgi:hypothetical protein
MVREFDMVGDYDLEPIHSVYDYYLNVNDVVEQELTSDGRDFYQMASAGWHRRRRDLTLHRYFLLMVQKVGVCFGIYHSGGPESSFRLRKPSGVFTSEISVIFVALIQIRARRTGRYLVVTDSMSSLKALQTRRVAPMAHSLVYEIKEACWWLKNNGYEIHMM